MSMSTNTLAAPFETMTSTSCSEHPGRTCVKFALKGESAGTELLFIFVTACLALEPTQISVVTDLLVGCKPYRAPAGFEIVNNREVHFFWPSSIHMDVVNEAKDKLKEKLDVIVTARNATHRRDPQTRLVHPR